MIKKIKNGFEIYHDGMLFIKHTTREPGFFFGNKDLHISMKNGEFEISNNTLFSPVQFTKVENDTLYFNEGKIVLSLDQQQLIMDLSEVQVPFKIFVQANATEKIFGMGEHFTSLNLRGNVVKNWVEEHITRKQIYNKILVPKD